MNGLSKFCGNQAVIRQVDAWPGEMKTDLLVFHVSSFPLISTPTVRIFHYET